ncbi:6-O-methylguanine DNA methyltransferase [Oleiphilus sp. HI0085]|uniref:bifunctional transcriptional activator/DNA repair enzyme AdaA n=1 Tax=Oleiphilus sp. HI0061 TaxID=1822239 RepID=UPI0007C28638|nr:methylated-DNA--[protein]-cysteine S-methyltransferase [Oleiphilus sp. HI0061]KZY65574.1 6-O-methylguanine DNA methyltransferase [Oleiphilus sp. HI0061]KZY78778.1 6-O-methylguanine DNA methyltransferase [Oleiphilus sp. HI0069]KZZ37244.1 6-O-methylguanine DNA methyltransferase [Oleiphilus sp. HI0085]
MARLNEQHRNYQKVAQAMAFIEAAQYKQPSLKDIAKHIGLSEFHLQRVFTQWAGVSPKQFLQFLTKQKAKALLKQHSVSNSAYNSGLSGSGRLHDLMVQCKSVTPGEYKSGGQGVQIDYGFHPSPFGYCLLALTQRGLCKLAFLDSLELQAEGLAEMKREWPHAELKQNQASTLTTLKRIFDSGPANENKLNLLCKGTPFQLLVWEALLKIPEGELRSYQQVAEQINQPNATRAVASAIAKNNIAYLIPCHRVIRSTGEINQYRWGAERKKAMISLECCSTIPSTLGQ